MLDYAERTRKRVLKVLADIARDEGYGRTVILVFDSADRYYEYVANYHPDTAGGEELAFSSGMFIDSGYGHFVFVADDLTRIEPVIAHELTHALVRHLPLPLWINEGIAVNTERRLCPREGSHFTIAELKSKYSTFWNEDTIQEFWSGKSWLRPDEGNSLSYELATTFIGLAAKDWPAFASFVCAADASDAGDTAAQQYLGYPVASFAKAVLGSGQWAPVPSAWEEGVERDPLVNRPVADLQGTERFLPHCLRQLEPIKVQPRALSVEQRGRFVLQMSIEEFDSVAIDQVRVGFCFEARHHVRLA